MISGEFVIKSIVISLKSGTSFYKTHIVKTGMLIHIIFIIETGDNGHATDHDRFCLLDHLLLSLRVVV